MANPLHLQVFQLRKSERQFADLACDSGISLHAKLIYRHKTKHATSYIWAIKKMKINKPNIKQIAALPPFLGHLSVLGGRFVIAT